MQTRPHLRLTKTAKSRVVSSYAPIKSDKSKNFAEMSAFAKAMPNDNALCERMRDRLLGQHASLELLIAVADRVMCAEFPEHKKQKAKRSDEECTAEWERFVGFAVEGSKCLTPLKAVSGICGRDKVQHYLWAYKGKSFCDKLCAAARQVNDWDGEAAVKLSILIHRRFRQPRRRIIKDSVDPIEADDLVNLKARSHRDSFVKKNDSEGIVLPFTKLAPI